MNLTNENDRTKHINVAQFMNCEVTLGSSPQGWNISACLVTPQTYQQL